MGHDNNYSHLDAEGSGALLDFWVAVGGVKLTGSTQNFELWQDREE